MNKKEEKWRNEGAARPPGSKGKRRGLPGTGLEKTGGITESPLSCRKRQ